jgi:hypothetical protein
MKTDDLQTDAEPILETQRIIKYVTADIELPIMRL